MEVVHTIPELRAAVARARQAGKSVGFVPTMGCLHEGHLSLIRRAKQESGYVVVSIFVNPTQFGPNEDFAKYPRTFEDDRQGCEVAGASLIFAPSAADFYPAGASTWVDVEGISAGLCGEFRPGHFRGVATVVAMLFNAAQADVAVFGRKDLQQLAVIRRMVRDLHFPVRIIGHETVREPNGVAMSSRNRYLSAEQLTQATAIPSALSAAQALAKTGVTDAVKLRTAANDVLAAQPALKPQYCEIVDLETMAPVASTAGKRCAIAVACHLGATRLIDNADL
ncbi:MAG: pantoate--beta-alanine ligase [Verrucomicrobia bacterium]|nr:MAG: pantoate--beta-alanine ligase [Verrucomicrobiota bacterium]